MKKLKTLQKLVKEVSRLKKQGKKIVFTNGCFDLFHYGHLISLQKAKSLGNILIVGINSDRSVKKLKGKGRPIVPEKERAAILCGLEAVDYCVIFDQDTPYKLIRAITPDVLVKGTDYKSVKVGNRSVNRVVGRETVEGAGGKVVLIPLVKNISASGIIKKLQGVLPETGQKEESRVLRIIDANFNRVREAFRVIEESMRFYYNDAGNALLLRKMRHDFTEKMLGYYGSAIKSYRNVEKDSGKDFSPEGKTASLTGLISRNFSRIEEGLRVIEEYSRLLKPETVRIWTNLRFETYKIEKRIFESGRSLD